ncbi:MAG: hypothetical protein Q8R31_05920 [Candidatus Omnitrophota bacterium]|nr:hypothetical protein [Candidatus Omnitrophota bacterium]
MAHNSGSVYVETSFRPRGREKVFVAGRIKIGTPGYSWAGTANQFIYPKDLGLKRIESIVFNPWRGMERISQNAKRAVFMTGSIGSMDNIDIHQFEGTPSGCYVVVKPFQIRGSRLDALGGTYSAYIGTIGRITANFWATGN